MLLLFFQDPVMMTVFLLIGIVLSLLFTWLVKKFRISLGLLQMLLIGISLTTLEFWIIYRAIMGYIHKGNFNIELDDIILLLVGLIMLSMAFQYWRKQKKNQVLNNSDENADAEAAQASLLANDAQQPLEDQDKNQP